MEKNDQQENISDNTSIQDKSELPPLLSLPLPEGCGRVLRYKSGLNPKLPLSYPSFKQGQSSGRDLDDDPLLITETRRDEHCRSSTILVSCTPTSSTEHPQLEIEHTVPLNQSYSNDIFSQGTCSGLDGEVHVAAEERSSSRLAQSETSPICNACFSVGDPEDNHSQSSTPINCSDRTLATDLPPPPSYESACRKKLMGNSSSVNTIDSMQPPTYRDAVGRARYLEDAPPNYHTLFTQSVFRMMDIRGDIVGNSDVQERSFCSVILTHIFLTVIIIFIVGMVVPLPFTMIVIGVTHLQSCPAQPRIPVFLTSLGVFQLLECCGRLSMYIYSKLRVQHSRRDETRYKSKDPFVYFIVVWFVVGSMWVYQNYPTCHDVIPQDVKTLRHDGFDKTEQLSNHTFILFATRNALLHNKTLQPTASSTRQTHSRLRSSQNRSTASATTDSYETMAMRTTARVPEKMQKAACCGRVVYFFTFSIVTFYYSLVGILFFVHICGNVIRLMCRCRRQNSNDA